MQTMDFDWRVLLRHNATWDALPRGAREAFLGDLKPSPFPLDALGAHRHALEKAGYVERTAKKRFGRLPARFAPMREMLRTLRTYPVPEKDVSPGGSGYIASQFDHAECLAFRTHSRRTFPLRDLTSFDPIGWTEAFLASDDERAWERDHGLGQRPGTRRVGKTKTYFASPEIFELTKSIWRWLSRSPAPRTLQSLLDEFQQHSLAHLAGALQGGVRYLILFPSVDPKTLRLRFGLLPRVLRWAQREPASLPAPVQVTESFHGPFLLADLIQLLILCQADPQRLRTDDGCIYKRTQQAILDRTMPVPPEILGPASFATDDRVIFAQMMLMEMGLARVDHTRARGGHLRATQRAKTWLALDGKDQLKSVFDTVREGAWQPPLDRDEPPVDAGVAREDLSNEDLSNEDLSDGDLLDGDLLDEDFHDVDLLDEDDGFRSGCGRITAHNEEQLRYAGPSLLPPVSLEMLQAALDPARGTDFLPVDAYLDFAAEVSFPVTRDREKGAVLADAFDWPGSYYPRSKDQLIEEWKQILAKLLFRLLLPLGAIEVAPLEDDQIAFRITGMGEYFLRWASDFDYGVLKRAEIVVQPNFEIVFLTPSPLAAARIGLFAEPTGSRGNSVSSGQTGTLYKITHASILSAAAVGATSREILTILRDLSSKPVPKNVETEIEGWFARCRRVRVAKTVIIECPDEDTARRVLVSGKSLVRPLGAKFVELRDATTKAQLVRRLRKDGIFVSP